MTPDIPPSLDAALLDDFYAECDELLTAVRAGLVELEGSAETAGAGVLEALFRQTHTLKGNAAIVGLRPAEAVAHAMESVFRALGQRQIAVGAPVLAALFAAAQHLERIVAAHRAQRELPERPDLLDELHALLPALAAPVPAAPPSVPTPAEPPTPADPLAAARARGQRLFQVSFAPSRERDASGINLASVRTRLAALGEILRAAPVVQPDRTMLFEFVLGLPAAPSDLAAWEADGIRFAEMAQPAPAVAPTAAASALAERGEALSLAPSHIVRVDLAHLDELMRITGELVIQRSRFEARLQQSAGAYDGLRDINLGLTRSLREMREALTRVRMVPIGEIFTRMPFVVRDLARGSDRRARVVLEGQQTQVDKYLVERLKEPLLHLVRNAFAHGIEPATERTAAGKPAEATLTLRAQSVGEFVRIQVRDDGRGIDAAAVLARATDLGLSVPNGSESAQLLHILCAPGFSTRTEADRAAGRGVGMAVVAKTVRELGGVLSLESWPGHGTEFTLRLPVSLSIGHAFIVQVAEQICAVPQSAVDEIVQVPVGEVRTVRGTELAPYRGGLLPILHLRQLFRSAPGEAAEWTLLVLSSERGAIGLVVDRVQAQREIVIRPLSDPLLRVPGFSGATELGDGRLILILDPNALTGGVVRSPDKVECGAEVSGKQVP